jgi:hypothetical protein
MIVTYLPSATGFARALDALLAECEEASEGES